jgi:hypothetical protein
MWQLQNHTPFAAERAWVRDINGAEVWLVAVKGTYLIKPDGSTELAEKQEEVCFAPQYRGEPGKSSLVYESDLAHTKQATDIFLHGHAYAPPGRSAPQIDVTMKVARISKTLRVVGDRFWKSGALGVELTAPEPFERMPIIYERAFGGADQMSNDPQKHDWERRNPVGVGFAVKSDHLIGQRAHNVEYPDSSLSSWDHRPQPAGFGPIAGNWSPRLGLAGTYDEQWRQERLPLLPLDFNERYFQCAPEDQQAQGYLRGGEPVELYNLTPERVLRFNLPRVVLSFRTNFGEETVDHRAVLDTVILEPDAPRVIMVWSTMLPCHHKVLKLQETSIRQKQQLQLR